MANRASVQDERDRGRGRYWTPPRGCPRARYPGDEADPRSSPSAPPGRRGGRMFGGVPQPGTPIRHGLPEVLRSPLSPDQRERGSDVVIRERGAQVRSVAIRSCADNGMLSIAL